MENDKKALVGVIGALIATYVISKLVEAKPEGQAEITEAKLTIAGGEQ